MRDDRLRVMADDLASEIGIGLTTSLAGIPLDGEVLSLDIPQPAQLFEKRLVEARLMGSLPMSLMAAIGPAGMTIAIRCCFAVSCACAPLALASKRPIVKSRRLIRSPRRRPRAV
jgi:hypothetical protein